METKITTQMSVADWDYLRESLQARVTDLNEKCRVTTGLEHSRLRVEQQKLQKFLDALNGKRR